MPETIHGVKLVINEFGNGFINLADGRVVYVRKNDIFKWWTGVVDAEIWSEDERWYGRILEQSIVGLGRVDTLVELTKRRPVLFTNHADGTVIVQSAPGRCKYGMCKTIGC